MASAGPFKSSKEVGVNWNVILLLQSLDCEHEDDKNALQMPQGCAWPGLERRVDEEED